MKFDEIKSDNRKHLDAFEKWLRNKGLSQKTIDNHVSNVDFYINDFLGGYFEEDATQGCYKVSQFLGDWFIHKAIWSSCAHIKGNAASFKKFYACMLENGVVTQNDYDTLCEIIRDGMPDWLEEMEQFDSMGEADFYDL